MALLTFPFSFKTRNVQSTKHSSSRRKRNKQDQLKPDQVPKPKSKLQNLSLSSISSWDQFKNLLTCKWMDVVGPNKVDDDVKNSNGCRSIWNLTDVVHANTRSTVRPNNHVSHPSSSRGMQLRKLSGCYECHDIIDLSRYTLIQRSTNCVCSQCGEVFSKMASLENHQAVRHAVSELSQDDSGRNIVEIIFKSSWLKIDHPIFKIERILKVHNTHRTIQCFEECRDAVKIRTNANTTASRCAADGNELLRFHCTTIACSLGSRNTSSLCNNVPSCGICTIIRHGFQSPESVGIGPGSVRTSASSGIAHDCLSVDHPHERRAMLVCRVIAGKVNRTAPDDVAQEEGGPYDSMADCAEFCYNLEELYIFNSRAILPCFVVIYKTL